MKDLQKLQGVTIHCNEASIAGKSLEWKFQVNGQFRGHSLWIYITSSAQVLIQKAHIVIKYFILRQYTMRQLSF